MDYKHNNNNNNSNNIMSKELYNSNYNSCTTCEDIMNDHKSDDNKNKNVIITGGTSGLGRQTALTLANNGFNVIVTGRNKEQGELLAANNNNIKFIALDFSKTETMKSFLAEYKECKFDKLDVLMLNAGTYGRAGICKDTGIANMIQINHIGNQALFTSLLNDLEKSDDPRVVVLSSKSHVWVKNKFPIDIVKNANEFIKQSDANQYGISKAANVLFAFEAYRKYPHISINALHPGTIKTGIVRESSIARVFFWIAQLFFKSESQGASTQLRLAVDPALKAKGGMYFEDCNPSKATNIMNDETVATELWDWTNSMVEKMNISE